MAPNPSPPSAWDEKALSYARQAALEIDIGIDAIPTLSAAIAALRVAAGEITAEAFGEDFGDDDSDTTTAGENKP